MPFRIKGAPGEESGGLGRTEINKERSSQSDPIATSNSGGEGKENAFALLVEDNNLNMKVRHHLPSLSTRLHVTDMTVSDPGALRKAHAHPI